MTLFGFCFQDPMYSSQCLRAMGAAPGGASDIGECLVTAASITDGDDESWYAAWKQIADRLSREASDSKTTGHPQSAITAFFRASNYYRTAEFFLHGNKEDPRILATWKRSRECFLEATRLMTPPIIHVSIPFEGTTLPGYLCLVDASDTKRPLVIVQTGFDGTMEELYFNYGQAAIKRGFNCLLFEGPGQGGVIREQKIPFRPNWETVITPVIDFAVTQKQVDKDKIVLMGISMGGYLVPRALAFEKRIKLGIANGGIFDLAQGQGEITLGTEEETNLQIAEQMRSNSFLRWFFVHGMYTFNASNPVELLTMTRSYCLKDVVGNISCKMLVVDSEGETMTAGQSHKLFEALQCPKEFMLFLNKDGAGRHCQQGAKCLSNERIFNWIEDNLK